MSWAAGRETTRTEEAAYCLLGIFDVNMPLLYGEGNKAFLRLQQEFLKESDDMTILAWSSPSLQDFIGISNRHSNIYRGPNAQSGSTLTEIPCGILATAPIFFAHSADYVPLRHSSKLMSIAAQGLSVHLSLRWNLHSNHFALDLGCRHRAHPGSYLSVVAKRVSKRQYARFNCSLDERKEGHFAWQRKSVHLIKTNEEAFQNATTGTLP